MKKNYFKNLLQVALLLAAPFVVSSCDDVIGQEDNPVASYVQWKTDADSTVVEMKVGGTYTRVATAVSSAIIAYESDNTEVATVDPVSGEVTAKKIGEANISAVVSGMSTNGRNVFEATKLTYKVNVIDKKIYVKALVEKTDSIVDFTANNDTIVDFSKKFKVFPATGLTVTYSIITPAATTTVAAGVNTFKESTTTDGKFTLNGKAGWCLVEAKITSTAVPAGYDDNTNALLKKDTIKVRVKDAIAYLNEKGERTILTADKYTAISEIDKTKFDGTFKAGTYFVDKALENLGTTLKAGGDVTFILENAVNSNIVNFVDTKDASTLNIFRQANVAITSGSSTMKAVGKLTVDRSTGGDAITNFKAINIYGGEITASSDAANCGGFAAIGNINVNGGKLTAKNTTNGYGISLLDGGKLTIAGGDVVATGKGSSTSFGYAVIGDVEISKGTFEASNSDYRAVKGNMSASGKIKIKESANGSTYTELKTATSNAPYIQAK